jgi:hypothetical protein
LDSTCLENRTERLGALRAPDAINYIDTPALFEKAVAAANGNGVQCDAEMAGAAPRLLYFAARVAGVWVTNFGSPVVPEVVNSTAGASASFSR